MHNQKKAAIQHLDYSVLQQCMHCGLCLPACPTYDATKLERSSPRGRISLMRAIADGELEITKAFGEEMYFCLGCLSCATACPAGVNYLELFETARADIENRRILTNGKRNVIRWLALNLIFMHPLLLRLVGRALFLYQATGLQRLLRKAKLAIFLPKSIRRLEPFLPSISYRHSDALIDELETPKERRFRVGLLTGCVQDLVYPEINRDTADVLLAHSCEVLTPRLQFCCGSLHAHNGELGLARRMARRNIVLMERSAGSLEELDAIITNAGGCGSHLKNYAHLLQEDPDFAHRARVWSTKVKDISEWLAQIGIRRPETPYFERVTYHESCHLCHGQKITREPREVMGVIPGVQLVEMNEATWCCGSAGIYNITQPELSQKLLDRKLLHILKTGATAVASGNTGCSIQIEAGLRLAGSSVKVVHPISLLAAALRRMPATSPRPRKENLG